MTTIRPYRLLAAAFLSLFSLASCTVDTVSLPGVDVHKENADKGAVISDIQFIDDYHRIKVFLDQTADIPIDICLEDGSGIEVVATDRNYGKEVFSRPRHPKVESIEWAGMEQVDELGVSVLAMVDLTRSREELQRTREILKRMHSTFGTEHLYIMFMYPENVMSPIMQASEYVLENYVSDSSRLTEHISDLGSSKPYVYRDVSTVFESLCNKTTKTAIDTASYTALVIFSAEESFNDTNNYPYDPKHFEVQSSLMKQMDLSPENLTVFFMNVAAGEDKTDAASGSNMMKVLCSRTGGAFMDENGSAVLLRNIFRSLNISVPDYAVTLVNIPDAIYYGKVRTLKLEFLDEDGNSIINASKQYYLGGDETGVVCAGVYSRGYAFFKGFVFTFALLAIAYLILQFAVPYYRYRLFRKKYVVKYVNSRQMVNSLAVPENCYLCKAPFKAGDSIVAKCSHIMHLECWNENDYHCPEYGPSCPEGSHFYDRKNLFNPRNAPYYAMWIFIALAVSFFAWSPLIMKTKAAIVRMIGDFVYFLVTQSPYVSDQAMDILAANYYLLPLYAFRNIAFLTFVFSFMTIHRRKWYFMLADAFVRTIIASSACFVFFLGQISFVILRQGYDSSIFTMWIPWFLSVLAAEYALTLHSNFRPKHKRYVYAALIIGVLSSIIFEFYGCFDTVSQIVNVLLGHVFLSVGIVLAIVDKMPRRQKSYLRMTGSIKEMDVALYKWFRANPNAVVTIGKSVDCSLQLYWDFDKKIEPIHASIKMVNGIHKLYVPDSEVFLNSVKVRPNSSKKLYYGDVIRIGSTRLTYLGI